METQCSIFSIDQSNTEDHFWHLFIDGAARGNPGPAGAGVVITKNNRLIKRYGYFLGQKTNNQAEYLAFLIALFLITEQFHIKKNVTIFSDSELLVRQIQGAYRVKNQLLLDLYNRAKQLTKDIDYKMKHIPRSENSYADAMANIGIDKKNKLPDQFFAWFNR